MNTAINRHPDPLDISLLDNPEIMCNENRYSRPVIGDYSTALKISFPGQSTGLIPDSTIPDIPSGQTGKNFRVKLESEIQIA